METAQPAYKQYPQTTPQPPLTPPPTKEEIKEKNLYSSSYGSIFLKNFLAGLGRSLGGLIIYVVFLFIIFKYVSSTILPHLEPLLKSFETINQLSTQQTQTPNTITPEQVNQLLKQTN